MLIQRAPANRGWPSGLLCTARLTWPASVAELGGVRPCNMRVALLFIVLLIPCTSFARMRAILVEITTHKDGAPTVSIYSTFKGEQRIDASIADAATVLEHAEQPGDGLDVSILVEGWIENEPFWKLLDALKQNSRAQLVYLETDRFFEAGRTSFLSAKGKELQSSFKTPEHTKPQSF